MEERSFVGRGAELSQLDRALGEALEGKGRLVLIGGPPGIGKTRLADELAALAPHRGAAVLWGRSWEGGGAPVYFPWAEALRSLFRRHEPGWLLDRLGDAAAPLGELVPELATVLGPSPTVPTLDSESARFRLFDVLTSFLVEASFERPLVLVMEDVHAFDTPSLLLTRFMARRLAESRILMVATYRDTELGDEASAAVADLMRERVARRIILHGLGWADVRRVVEESSGAAPSDRLVDAVHRHTDGNPLFLKEVVRHLDAEPGPTDPQDAAVLVAVPRELRQAIMKGLDRVSLPCRGILSLAAVAGREFRPAVLAEVEAVPEQRILGLTDEAIAARVIEAVPDRIGLLRFAHALIREVLYEDVPDGRRAELHRRIGEALEQLYAADPDAHVAELAHHFLEAAPAGGTEKAVWYAKEAGDRAIRVLAYEEAVRHYEMALGAADRGSTADVERCALLLSLGDALARAGDQDAARRMFLLAAEMAKRTRSAEDLARAALGYGGRFVWARAGGDPHVRTLLEEALDALPVEDAPLRARVMARLAGVLRDDPAREPRWSLSREAVEIARRLGDPRTIAYALESRWAAIWEPATARERLDIADELVRLAQPPDDPERALQAHGYRLHTLFELGDLDGVRAEHRTEQRLVETVRQPAQRWVVAAGSAALALFEGRFGEAEDLISRAVELGRRAQSVDAEVSFRLQTYFLRREVGDVETMEPVLGRSVEEFPWYPMFRCLLADLYAQTGRVDEAREMIHSLAVDDFGRLPADSQWLFSMTVLADAVAVVEDTERASVLSRLLSPSARLTGYSAPEVSTGSVSRGLGLLATTLSRWDQAIRHFEDAVKANRAMGAMPWLAHTYAGYGSALLRRGHPGDRDRAVSLLGEAASIAERLGMATLRHRIATLVEGVDVRGAGRADVEGRAPDGLFRREGDTWSIGFEGRTVRLTDSKGMRYLAELLRNPGREILALDLAGSTSDGPQRRQARAASEDGLAMTGGEQSDVLDREALAAYRRRLDELREELEESEAWSDAERAARARTEMEFVARELAAATGLGGRSRKMGSPAERARQSVTKALKLAIERIRREDLALGRHLESTVRTGTFCSYAPDPRVEIAWRS